MIQTPSNQSIGNTLLTCKLSLYHMISVYRMFSFRLLLPNCGMVSSCPFDPQRFFSTNFSLLPSSPLSYRLLYNIEFCFPSLKETSVLEILCNKSTDIDMFTIISNYTDIWRPKEIIRNDYRCFGMLIGTMVINQQALLTFRISKTGDRNPAFWRI